MFLKAWIVASNSSVGCPSLGDQYPPPFPLRVALRMADITDWISLPDNPAILLSRGHTVVPRVRFISSVSARYSLLSVLSNSHQLPSKWPSIHQRNCRSCEYSLTDELSSLIVDGCINLFTTILLCVTISGWLWFSDGNYFEYQRHCELYCLLTEVANYVRV
jgi:hypothetical protein